MRMVFTTSQVARICMVAPRTVSKWFDSGRLQGYRIPGSRDRRIPREHLIRFLREHGLPLGTLEGDNVSQILLVGAEIATQDSLRRHMNTDSFRLDTVQSGFDAGLRATDIVPDCIVIDFKMGRGHAVSLGAHLRQSKRCAKAIIIGLIHDEDNEIGFDRTHFAEIFRKPFDTDLLAARIRNLVMRKKNAIYG